NAFGSIMSSNALLTVLPMTNCTPVPSGILGWWRAESNATDSVGNHNGIMIGGAAFATGEVGQAFSFDGLTAAVNLGDWFDLQTFSVAMWVKASASQVTDANLIDNNHNDSPWRSWTVQYANTGLHFIWDLFLTGGDFAYIPFDLKTNTWQYLVLALDSNRVARVYLDGQMQGSTVLSGAISYNGSQSLSLGHSVAWGRYFNGLIDEVDVYNRALALDEIQAIYNAGSAGKCPLGVAPSIVTQPTSQSVLPGASATFTVSAAGTPPLSYQWLFNGTNIAGGNGTSLTLSNVQSIQAGNYSVRVTNAFGSITSSNALLTINAAPPCMAPPSGLVSWWQAEGNGSDTVGGNNGALSNGVTFVAGRVGQAFNFNGFNSYVQVPDSPALRLTNELTIEFWVKRRQFVTGDHILNKGGNWNSGPLNYGVAFDTSAYNNALTFFSAGGVRRASSITDSNWHHCAVVARNGDTDPTFYIDGAAQPVATRQGTAKIALGLSTRPLYIGAQIDPASGWTFYGNTLVDEMSIYNRMLTAAEIQGIYNAGSAGKCTSTIPPTPRGATATAYLVNDFVVGASITDGGYGYTNTPTVRIIGGGGIGAQAVAVVSNGVVIAINILDAGFGYTSTPDIYIAPPFIPPPTMGIEAISLLSFTNLVVGTNYQLQYYNDHAWSNLGAGFTAASSTFTQYVSGAADANRYRLASAPVPSQAYATAQVMEVPGVISARLSLPHLP
ncbi:MAG: immunoglobulin domain-containing protein, partial [Verrucomicrobia bacterium]|nr:immunoglobulin domain-containing protein [Verrucomicrobiota bacterium]